MPELRKQQTHFQINFARSYDKLVALVMRSPKNEYLLDRRPGPDMVMPLFSLAYPDDSQYFYIAAADNEIMGALEIGEKDNCIDFHVVSVKNDYRRQGLGTALVRSALAYAQQADKPLHISSFSSSGWRYLSKSIPALHRQYPGVELSYGLSRTPVTAYTPYSVYKAPNNNTAYVQHEAEYA